MIYMFLYFKYYNILSQIYVVQFKRKELNSKATLILIVHAHMHIFKFKIFFQKEDVLPSMMFLQGTLRSKQYDTIYKDKL